MTGELFIVDNGSVQSRELRSPPELEELQEAVDGLIEVIPYFETYQGKPCEPANLAWRVAFQKATGQLPQPEYLVGPVVIVTGDEEFLSAL